MNAFLPNINYFRSNVKGRYADATELYEAPVLYLKMYERFYFENENIELLIL